MKILMVLESDFPPDIRVENEIQALTEAGHEVHIACYSHIKHVEIATGLNYTIHKKYISPLRYKSSVGALKFDYYFKFWRKFLKSILRDASFDAIHVHDLPLVKIGYEVSSEYGLKFVIDLHENWPALLSISTHTQSIAGRILCSISQWEKYEAEYVNRANRVIVVVEEAKERLIKKGISPEKIYVVSNTLNLDKLEFPERSEDEEHVTIVYGGGVNFHRGLQYVINAFPLLLEKIPNLRFWIIGSGNYIQNLKDQVHNLSLENQIIFWGWKKQDELIRLISLGDYAIIPHIRSPHTDATIPHKIFQYMYAGIPIISSDCLPLDRILKETGTGVCFRDRDPESFASTFIKLHQDKNYLEKVPQNGKKWVEKKYNWENDSKTLLKLYNP